MPAQDRSRGFVWALASALLVAGFAIPWKLAAGVGTTSQNTLLLLLSAAILSTLLSWVQTRSLPRPRPFDLRLAAVLAALTLAGNLASAEAIRTLSSALLTVALRSEVVLAALIAWPLLGERVDRRYWLGAGVALLGLAVQQPPGSFDTLGPSGLGWALLGSLCFSAMAVVTRKYIHRIDPVAVNGLRLWLAVAMWFAIYGVPDDLGQISGAQLAYTTMAAVCGPFAGRLCMMLASRDLEVRLVTLFMLLAPIGTLVLAWVVLSELPHVRELVGGGVMLVGIAIPVLAARSQMTTARAAERRG